MIAWRWCNGQAVHPITNQARASNPFKWVDRDRPIKSYNGPDYSHQMDLRLNQAIRFESDDQNQTQVHFKQNAIATVHRDKHAWSTTENHFGFYKIRSSRREKLPAINLKILLVYKLNSCGVCFPVFVSHLCFQWTLEFKLWLREKEEITSWTPSSSLKIRNEKPCIRRLIGLFRRLLWVRLRDFILIFHHLVLILVLES